VDPYLYSGSRVQFTNTDKWGALFGGGGETEIYLLRTKGMGTQRRAKVPNAVDAHRGPRALYIFLASNYKEKGLASGIFMVQHGGSMHRESSTNDTTDKGLAWYAREPTQKNLTFE